MVYGSDLKLVNQDRHVCWCRISVHLVARVCLILALCLLSISLVLDYQDTKLTKAHEISKWSGTFKTILTIADLIVVFMALNGNLFYKRFLYIPFFIVHIQFLCAVAVTSFTLLGVLVNLKRDRDYLTNIIIYNLFQFSFMLIVLFVTFRSYRYVNEVREFLKEARYLDQI